MRPGRPLANPVTAVHEAGHAVAALHLGVPVLGVRAAGNDPFTELDWPEYSPRTWAPVLLAGLWAERLLGFPGPEAAAACDREQLESCWPWVRPAEACATVTGLLRMHERRLAQLAVALARVGEISGPALAAWWYRGKELPAITDSDHPSLFVDSAQQSLPSQPGRTRGEKG